MARPQQIRWQHEDGGDWTAWVDGVLVGTIRHGDQYELHTHDQRIQGSHRTLGSAQAQLGAWYSWLAAHEV